ncbi:uncharacterized protein TrAFT101_005761 [Trichoderma asperellum]|uniref:uncharacterized protein n=1 Tax=Trichoderma asperellum TaxID=101201 RepID=UPI00332D8619|nr:hypothetical protein TrAFT101_005761 [Trichoderma asperellum]
MYERVIIRQKGNLHWTFWKGSLILEFTVIVLFEYNKYQTGGQENTSQKSKIVMVGAAQYQDKEIDWVLSAVVSKKKQSYIQAHFKEKFGRALNHNQIRYIKNKYGKDPRFNSPLVNIRAPVRATTPEPDGSSDHEDGETQGNAIAFENQKEAGPSMATEVEQNEPEDDDMTATHPKRKRGSHEQGDALER